MSGEIYNIKSLGDFLNVPSDRLEACLAEFRVAVELMKILRDGLPLYSRDKVADVFNIGGFTWIDDGEEGGVINIKVIQSDES